MNILSLTNTCFKTCILKGKYAVNPKKNTEDEESSQVEKARLEGVFEYLKLSQQVREGQKWLLSEKETVCMHNCAKSYVELKGFLHE